MRLRTPATRARLGTKLKASTSGDWARPSRQSVAIGRSRVTASCFALCVALWSKSTCLHIVMYACVVSEVARHEHLHARDSQPGERTPLGSPYAVVGSKLE